MGVGIESVVDYVNYRNNRDHFIFHFYVSLGEEMVQELITWVALVATSFASDWCFTLYIRRASEGKAFPAALWSVLIVAFGAVNVISYTQNHVLLVPILTGYFAGTYFAVKYDHKGDTNGTTKAS